VGDKGGIRKEVGVGGLEVQVERRSVSSVAVLEWAALEGG